MTRGAMIFLLMILGGCANQGTGAVQQTLIAARANAAPRCSGETQCRAMWEAAQLWIVKNSRYKVQTATEVVIETFGSVGQSIELAYRALKEPVGGGVYKITLTAGCANWFGCRPDPLAAKADFNRAVADAGARVSANASETDSPAR